MHALIPKIKSKLHTNRSRYLKKLSQHECCIVHIDINNFSFLGFKYGFNITNKLLEIVSERLLSNLTDEDFVENIYADDFILFLKGNKNNCIEKLKYLKEELDKPIFLSENLKIKLYYRIAVIHYPNDIQNLNEAIDYLIMFSRFIKSKELEGIYYFDKTESPIFEKLKTFIDFIYDVNFDKHLVPAFQGIYDLNSNKIFGYEVLTRVCHNNKIYDASQLIDIFTYFKINMKSDEVIINKALQYKIDTNDHRIYFFNIVPEYFYQYVDMITSILDTYKNKGLNTSEICIELTEISELAKFDEINKTFRQLKKQYNLMFAIDDFGSGYSNLNVFTSLQIDFLKIDKELIENVKNNPITGYLLKSITELSLFRNIAIIGEGIDSAEKLRLINKLGFDYAQGFYLSKPEVPKKFLT
ncbi:EAL domain-containing protein [Deferribacter autotrophicus]|uniref:EAL domain-containing protein n=1 Tax=Deferribacter autotrophicus TaxID=500465 RepID=A0A5A8F594_9BACT|nr:GGDEF domain-containing phosphodiesterase [Deferribacter autotrophicus]KAA0258860.1 EAL domain-containing protein [Deferribacter autotrophicus]